jgi:hypothetical protein
LSGISGADHYQRLLRYPIPELTNRLAGTAFNLMPAATDLAHLIRDGHSRRPAA